VATVVRRVETSELQELLAAGAQLLEVTPGDGYAEEHLPSATHLPLGELDSESAATLDRARPVVVYGFDHECDRSARAAARLEALGFTDVAEYRPGKAAWLAEGLASEGRRRPEQRVAAIADPDVPLVPAGATVAEAAAIVGTADIGIVVTDDDDRTVLGVVRPETFGLPPTTPVADVLQPGPSTFRPSMSIGELVTYFRESDESRAIVSTLAGRWIGLIRRGDVLDG
jgi:rhodanese-related sulfurtransferase